MTLFIYSDEVLYADDRRIILDRNFQAVAPDIESKVIVTDHHYIAVSGFPDEQQKYIDMVRAIDCVWLLLGLVEITRPQYSGQDREAVGNLVSLLSGGLDYLCQCDYINGKSFVAMCNTGTIEKDGGSAIKRSDNTLIIHGAGSVCASLMVSNGVEIRDVYAQCRRAGIPVGEDVHEYRMSDLKKLSTLYRGDAQKESLTNVLMHCRARHPKHIAKTILACAGIYEIISLFKNGAEKQSKKFTKAILTTAQALTANAFEDSPYYDRVFTQHLRTVLENLPADKKKEDND